MTPTPEEQRALDAKIQQQLRDLEGAIRMKDQTIETLRNSQCACLPIVERERDELRKKVVEQGAKISQQQNHIYAAVRMLIEDLDEDQLQSLIDRLNIKVKR